MFHNFLMLIRPPPWLPRIHLNFVTEPGMRNATGFFVSVSLISKIFCLLPVPIRTPGLAATTTAPPTDRRGRMQKRQIVQNRSYSITFAPSYKVASGSIPFEQRFDHFYIQKEPIMSTNITSCVCYIRCSTEEQAREGVTLQAQEERLNGYCMMAGLSVLSVIREEGISGRTPIAMRPGGKDMMRLIREKKVQNVVALKLDRLFRDAEDALRQTRQWDEGGIALHLVDMGGTAINTASAMGRLLITMMSGFAELERNLIAERTAAALQHKKRHQQAYSPTPYGFQREGNVLIPDPEEMAVISRIRTLNACGASLRSIAGLLNEESIPAKRGGSWNPSTLWYVLRNSQCLEE